MLFSTNTSRASSTPTFYRSLIQFPNYKFTYEEHSRRCTRACLLVTEVTIFLDAIMGLNQVKSRLALHSTEFCGLPRLNCRHRSRARLVRSIDYRVLRKSRKTEREISTRIRRVDGYVDRYTWASEGHIELELLRFIQHFYLL